MHVVSLKCLIRRTALDVTDAFALALCSSRSVQNRLKTLRKQLGNNCITDPAYQIWKQGILGENNRSWRVWPEASGSNITQWMQSCSSLASMVINWRFYSLHKTEFGRTECWFGGVVRLCRFVVWKYGPTKDFACSGSKTVEDESGNRRGHCSMRCWQIWRPVNTGCRVGLTK